MIISDPFGSWVQGAHEGLQDAVAMRQAQDNTAQQAYNLQKESTVFDPLRARMAQNSAATSDLELGANQDIYGSRIPQQEADVALQRGQLANATAQTGLGDPAAYYKFAVEHAGGQYTPAGGIRYPVTGIDGQVHYVSTPQGSIVSPQQLHYGDLGYYHQATIGQRQEGHDIQQERLDHQYGSGNGNLGDVFGGAFNKPAPQQPQFNYYNTTP